MIYIFTAFYAEAKNIIARYNLKMQQKQAAVRFDIFSNDDIRLVITGVGEINAATAVANVGGAYGIGAEDVIVNIGSCAAFENETHTMSNDNMRIEAMPDDVIHIDTVQTDDMCTNIAQEENKCTGMSEYIYLINKITEQSTGRTFYPDMLLKSDIDECEAVTAVKPLTTEEMKRLSERSKDDGHAVLPCVYDMEAAAVYQAASLFVGPHCMHFIKVVSDSGEKIDQSRITEVFAAANDTLCGYIDRLIMTKSTYATDDNYAVDKAVNNTNDNISCNINSTAIADAVNEKNKYHNHRKRYNLEQIIADMKCSKVMGDQLGQLIKYCALSGIDYESVIKEFYSIGKLPCSSKKAGKVCLEELKSRLL